jgi:tRNA(Leu) C34 or U34 (ribose-2'-O)-methylase TrmL
MLPRHCSLVGIELDETAVDLPSFAHPRQAAYVLGPERGSLSPEMVARCDHLIRIPTSFCLNQATAGAVVMYDRIKTLGRWPARPISPLSEPEPLPPHRFGNVVKRTDGESS